MAEGGVFSQTVLGASDEIYDFNCSRCEEEGGYKEAHKYCENCKLYYCKKCLRAHNKFPALRQHVIKDVTSQTGPPNTSSQSEQCKSHPDEEIKMYCGEHDLVCCTVCIALDHRDCKDVQYISKIANGIRTSQDYTSFVKDIAGLRLIYEATKKSILNERKKLSDIKTEIIAEINSYKRELVARIDELERKSVEAVNERCEKITEKMDTTLSDVDELLNKVRKNEREIEHASEAMLFISMKTVSLINSEADEIDQRIENFEGLSFSIDKRIKDVFDNSDRLVTSNFPIKTHAKTECDLVLDNVDHIELTVRDLCILDDGDIILTFDNTLKRLDRSFDTVRSKLLQGECWGVCTTSNSKELAVTIRDRKLVQYVEYYDDKAMTLTNSFTVGALCKGICFKDKHLFIACGGGDHDTVPGQLRKYSMKGYLVCTIDTDETGQRYFTSPRFMAAVNSTLNDIYITDKQNGVIVLRQNGQVESYPYNSFLKKGLGLFVTTKKNILVSSGDSNNIQQYDEKFRFVGTVINFTKNKHKPTCIMLDEFKKKLIVFLYGHRKVYIYDVEC